MFTSRAASLAGVRELREHWWNGVWGRMNRRDVWLYRNTEVPEGERAAWMLRVHKGWSWELDWVYSREERARADLQELVDTNDIGDMRRIG